MDDEDGMQLALSEARLALKHEDVPIGAVIEANGLIVASRHNERERLADPCAHAEILALRDAAKWVGSWRLTGLTMFVTLEPCSMCAGALVASRIERVVFGARDVRAGACGSLYNICEDPRLNHQVSVVSGTKATDCSSLLTEFFKQRRKANNHF